MASNFEEGLTQEGIGTKILPSALNWHYVAYWDHIRLRMKNPNATWPSTDSIIRQAIAIPISVKMKEEETEKIISAVKKVAKSVLL
jgi:8-amino-3,8-dideoxy-alpha-D-manno-octulosonate transaminase